MFDLALDPFGDLIFTEDNQKARPFKLKFYIGKTPALRINFNIVGSNALKRPKNGLSIKFDIAGLNNNKRALTLEDSSAKSQAIKIRLLTVLGDIKERENIGSLLNSFKHKNLHDKDLPNKIINAVYLAIEDILPEANIKAIPVSGIIDGIYTQAMQIYIYQDDFLIFSHILKG